MAGKIRGITIELSADATGLLDSLKDINSNIKNTSSQLKDVDRLLKLDPSNTQLLRQKTQLLQEQIGNCTEKLEILKQAQADMDANGVDKNSEQYQALQREIISTESELSKLKDTADNSSSKLEKVSEVTGKIGDKMEAIGKKMSIVSAALVAFGTAAVKSFEDVDNGADIVIKKTGATGDAAEELEQSYKNVAKGIVADWDDIGSAIGEVNTRFKLTGEDLEDLSEEFLKFADINEMDVTNAVAGVDMAMKTFNVDQSEAQNVMGLLSKTSQDTGISMDTLLGLLQSSGPTLKEMGLDLGSSVTLMGNFEAAGIDSNEMLGKMTKAATYFNQKGKDMNEGLSDLITRLQDSSTESDATAEAYEIFGNRAGLAFVTAAKEGKISIDDLSTVMSDYGTVVDDTYQQTLDGTDQMKLAWQNLQLGMSELGAAIGETLAPIMDKITEVIQSVVEWFTNLDDGTKNTIVTIGLLVAAIGPLLVVGGKVMSGISSITSALSSIGTATTGPIGLAIAAAAALVAGVTALATGLNDAYKEASPFTEAIEGMQQANADLATSIENTRTAYDNSAAATEAQAGLAQNLYGHLQDLIAGYDGTAEKQAEIQGTIDALNETVPGLGLAWDSVTNSLNLTNDEIYANIEAMRAQAEVVALQDLYTESLKQQYTAQQNLTEATKTAGDVLSQYGLTTQDVLNYINGGVAAEAEWSAKLMESGVALWNVNDATEEIMMAMDGYLDASENSKQATENVTFAEDKLAEAMQNAATATQTASSEIVTATDQSAQVAENAQKTGEAYTDTLSTTIESGADEVDAASQAVADEMDISEESYEYGEDGGASFNEGLASQTDNIQGTTEEIYDTVTGTMDPLPGDMQNAGDESGGSLEGGFGDWKGTIEGTVEETYNYFLHFFSEILPPMMKTWGSGAGMNLNQGIQNYQGDIQTTISNIVSDIDSGLSVLPGYTEAAGYDGGAGLYNGLQSWEGALYSLASNIAWNISSTIRAAFNSHSPSRVMMAIGDDVGAGLAIGIEESGEAAIRTSADVANNIIDAFDTSGINALSSGMNSTLQMNTARADASGNAMAQLVGLLSQYMPYLASDKNIHFDDGTWAGVLTPAIVDRMQELNVRAGRG